MTQDFESLRDELEQALGGLDARQTQLRPGGESTRWSIQQTVEHLVLTYAATVKAIDAQIAKGAATQARPSLVQRLGQFVIIRGQLFPPGRKSPKIAWPDENEAAVASGVLIERVGSAVMKMDLSARAGEEIFGAEQRPVRHIILGPLSMIQWRRFHLIHGRHHMKFIAKTRKEFGI